MLFHRVNVSHSLSILGLVTNGSKRTAVTRIIQCRHTHREREIIKQRRISDFRFFFHQHFDLICFGCSFTNGLGLTMMTQVELTFFAWITRNERNGYLYDFGVFISSMRSLQSSMQFRVFVTWSGIDRKLGGLKNVPIFD